MIHFYAKALNADGRVAQMLVTKVQGRPTAPAWTGKVYRSDAGADRDISRLNVEIARQRAEARGEAYVPDREDPR